MVHPFPVSYQSPNRNLLRLELALEPITNPTTDHQLVPGCIQALVVLFEGPQGPCHHSRIIIIIISIIITITTTIIIIIFLFPLLCLRCGVALLEPPLAIPLA